MLRLIKSKFKGTITRVEAKNALTYLCLITLNPRLNHKKYLNLGYQLSVRVIFLLMMVLFNCKHIPVGMSGLTNKEIYHGIYKGWK